LVGLLSHNNNSIRYAANLQTAQTPDSVIAHGMPGVFDANRTRTRYLITSPKYEFIIQL
jgi:hypothetical protein